MINIKKIFVSVGFLCLSMIVLSVIPLGINTEVSNVDSPQVSAIPVFDIVPVDLTMQNDTLGYFLQWTITDDNLNRYIILNNESGPTAVDSGTYMPGDWSGSDMIQYDIPELSVGDYEITLNAWDEDDNLISDMVYLFVSDLGLPEINNLTFWQNGVQVNEFESIAGSTIEIKYQTSGLIDNVTISPLGRFNEYKFAMDVAPLFGLAGALDLVILPTSSYNYTFIDFGNTTFILPVLAYNNNTAPQITYNGSLDQYTFIPDINTTYYWYAYANAGSGDLPLLNLTQKNMLDLEWGLINILNISINGGLTPFTLEGVAYDWSSKMGDFAMLSDSPCYIEIENVDSMAPILTYDGTFVNTTSGYLIECSAFESASESGIKSAMVYYTVGDDTTINSIALLDHKGNLGGVIPTQDGVEVTYWIEITDYAGNVAISNEYTLIAEAQLSIIYLELMVLAAATIAVASIVKASTKGKIARGDI